MFGLFYRFSNQLLNQTCRTAPIFLAISMFVFAGCTPLTNLKLESIESSDLTDVEIQFGIARAIERKGNYIKARDAYLEILAQTSKHAPSLHRLGVIAVRLDDLDLAVERLQTAVQLDSANKEMLGDLGYAQFLNSNYEAAADSITKALILDPSDKRNLNNMALVFGYQGKMKDCLNLFRRVNDESEALNNLGYVFSQTGDLEAARRLFHKSIDLNPKANKAANALVELQRAAVQQPQLPDNQ